MDIKRQGREEHQVADDRNELPHPEQSEIALMQHRNHGQLSTH
jgi:hypothetical protein